MKLPLSEIIGLSIGTDMERALIRSIDEEITRRQAGFTDREAFFESLSSVPGSAKGHWSRAIKTVKKTGAPNGAPVNSRQIVAVDSLVKFLRLLRPVI